LPSSKATSASTTFGFKLVVEDRGNLGLGELQAVADRVVAKGNSTPGLAGVFTSLRADTPWLYLDIDRLKAKSLGISLNGGMADRAADHIHDELHARCLVLDNGATRLAIVYSQGENLASGR
jgi:hypothetical protein